MLCKPFDWISEIGVGKIWLWLIGSYTTCDVLNSLYESRNKNKSIDSKLVNEILCIFTETKLFMMRPIRFIILCISLACYFPGQWSHKHNCLITYSHAVFFFSSCNILQHFSSRIACQWFLYITMYKLS